MWVEIAKHLDQRFIQQLQYSLNISRTNIFAVEPGILIS